MEIKKSSSSAKKTSSSKLRTVDSRREYYGSKLREGKADNSLTEEEVEKSKKLKQQSQKKGMEIAKEKAKDAAKEKAKTVAKAAVVVDTVVSEFGRGTRQEDTSDNCDTADEVISETGHVMGASGSLAAKKIKSAKYSKQIHGRKAQSRQEATGQTKKNLMKKQIQAHAAEQQRKNVENAGKIGRKITDKAEDVIGKIGEFILEFVKDNPVISLIIVLVLIVILMFSGVMTSCGAMGGVGNNITVVTTYSALDDDILDVDDDYTELEEEIQEQIDDIESEYEGYDEYNYTLDEIGHNPYELAALLTVLFEDYTRDEVQDMLQTILELQYELTIEEEVETREREVEDTRWVEDYTHPDGGYWEDYTYTEEYDYYILNVTLTNHGLDHVVEELGLSDDQVQRYEILKATYGNKKYLFDDIYSIEEPEDEYDVPGEYLTDIEFARMLHEAESHLGLSYVWGGYSPVSGFDCSGFVSWVINHCGNGWNVGRQTANGLKVITDRVRESDVKPGDLVFFKGTYNTTGASHVGIVVDPVNHVMIHAGNPIKYSNYDTPYWRAHMYCYGRIRR